MDDKIKATVEKIKQLAKQNSEFAVEMYNLFGFQGRSQDNPAIASISPTS